MSDPSFEIGFTPLLERIAETSPETEVRHGERSLSAVELLERSARLAQGMSEWGIGCGDRLAIWMLNCLEWLEVWAAACRLGAVVVPLNTRFSVAETRYVLEHSGSRHLVWAAGQGALDAEELAKLMAEGLVSAGVARLAGEPELRDEIALDSLRADTEAPVAERDGEIGMIQYTSGSTAFPKGAKLRTTGLVRNGHGLGAAWRMARADRVLCSNPLFHCGGSVFAFMAGFTHGASIELMDRWRAEDGVRLIAERGVTVAPVIDAALRDIVSHVRAHGNRLPSLRLVSTAADRVLFERAHETLGCEVSNVYGLTECSPNVCVGNLDDPLETRLAHIGRPQPGVEVDIRDPETGESVGLGQVGEIVVRGWNVMEEYHDSPEANKLAFYPDGYLRTGDLGRIGEDGYLDYLGRVKLMIKSGGENVSIEEVEAELRRHSGVADAVVVPVPHERFGEVGYAFLRPQEGMEVDPEEVMAVARERLAGFKLPKHAGVVDDLPRTGSGKVDRVLLAERARRAVAGRTEVGI